MSELERRIIRPVERFKIYRCPTCGKLAEGWKMGPRFCAGNQWLMDAPLRSGDHPPAEMDQLTVEVVDPPVVTTKPTT